MKRSWWVSMFGATFVALVALAGLAGATSSVDRQPPPVTLPSLSGRAPSGGTEGELGPTPAPSRDPRTPGEDSGAWWIPVMLGLAGLGLAISLWSRRRKVEPHQAGDDQPAWVLEEAISVLDDGSPADAITAAWRELERLAASLGVERVGSEPADAFATRLAGALRMPIAQVGRLGELFERAWYSRFGSDPADAAEARTCLPCWMRDGA